MEFRFRLLTIITLLMLAGCAGTKVPITPQEEYAEANQLQDAEFFEEASAQFEEYVKKYPESNSADNAKLQIANGHFRQGKYEEAIAAYQEILTSYPEGDAADQAALSIGDAYFAQRKIDKAIEAYEELLLKYPRFSTQIAASAQDRMNAVEDIEEDMRIIRDSPDSEKDNAQYDIAHIYFSVFGDYERAGEEFQRVLDQWPRSELADEALWKLGECYWNIAARRLPFRSFSDEHKAYMRLMEIYDRYPQLTGLDLFRLDAHWPAGKRGDNYEISYAEVRRIVNKYPGIKERRVMDFLPENYRRAFQAWDDVIQTYSHTDTAASALERIARAFMDIGNLYHNMGLKHYAYILFRESLATIPTPEGHLGMARYYASITSTSGLPWAYRRAFFHIKKAEELTPPGSSMANEVSWAKEWMNYKMRIESLENWPND
ncbi:tetratricopeptide repeat protein [Candidatus Poribacteria bacterium]